MSAAVAAVGAYGTSSPYDEAVIRKFTIATMFWGVVGFLVGTFIACSWPSRPSISAWNGPPSAGCGRCTPRR